MYHREKGFFPSRCKPPGTQAAGAARSAGLTARTGAQCPRSRRLATQVAILLSAPLFCSVDTLQHYIDTLLIKINTIPPSFSSVRKIKNTLKRFPNALVYFRPKDLSIISNHLRHKIELIRIKSKLQRRFKNFYRLLYRR